MSSVPVCKRHCGHEDSSSPIFIIGTERSGTNLLRLMLHAHSRIVIPHPPHIMKFFAPLEPLYGNLERDANFRRLIDDVCRMVELHPYPWEITPNREQVFRQAQDRSLIAIYFAIYDQYLAWSSKGRWGCKSTFMIDHVADILRYYPDARFIFMVRDGRDVAVSAKQSIFNHYHVYYTARRWQREQRLGLDWLAKLPAEQIMLLKYEDLLADPPGMVRQLCVFLGEEFQEQMLDYHRQREAQKSGSLSLSWENTAKPVLSGNKEKFRRQLSEEEILLFEAIAAKELGELGYPLINSPEVIATDHHGLAQPKVSYALREFLMSVRTEARHLHKDNNSLLRLKKLWFMKYLKYARRFTRIHG